MNSLRRMLPIVIISILLGSMVTAFAIPVMPMPIHGTVYIDDEPASAGYHIYVKVGTDVIDLVEGSVDVTDEDGQYDIAIGPESELADGTEIDLWVDEHNVTRITLAYNSDPLEEDLYIEAAVSDFSVSVLPATDSVDKGGSTSATVTVTAIEGYALTVTLSSSGEPAGVTVSFVPTSGTPTFTSTMNIEVATTASVGEYPITITGTGTDNKVRSITAYTLTVTDIPLGYLELDEEYYHTGETVRVSLLAENENFDPAQIEIVGVLVHSDTDVAGKTIALRETGVNTGLFKGTFKLVGVTPGTGELLVSTGDTVDVAYSIGDDPEPTYSDYAIVDDTAPVVEITKIDEVVLKDTEVDFIAGAVTLTATIDEGTDFDLTFEADNTLITAETEESGTGGAVEKTASWDTLAGAGITWPDHTYTVTVTATDSAGNIGSDSITVTVDNTAPESYNHEPIGGYYTTDITPTISFDIIDLGGGVDEDSIAMDIDGMSLIPLEITEILNGYHVEYSLGSSEALSEGPVNVVVTASDEVDIGDANELVLEIPITDESVGISTGSATFYLDYTPILDSETIYVDGRPKVKGTGVDEYGLVGKIITFVTAPKSGAVITAEYDTETWSFTIDLTEPEMVSASATSTTCVKVTFDDDLDSELDPETVQTSDFIVDGAYPSKVSVTGLVVKLTVAKMPTDDTPKVTLTGNGVADRAGNYVTVGEETAEDKIKPEVSVTVSPALTTTYTTSGVKTIFTLTFSETMNTVVEPKVSYGELDTGKDIGIGTGTKTVFYLLKSPIVAGSETIYLDEVAQLSTAYTLVDATGMIIFSTAPAAGVVITADYCYYALPIAGDWTSVTVWEAEYAGIPQTTHDGWNYISIIDAKDITSNVMKTDISNRFKIDTTVSFDKFSPADEDVVYRNNPIVVIIFKEAVTVTAATFDEEDALVHEDVLADLTTMDYKTYRLVTSGLTHEEEYTITVSAEDALGNELLDASATFEIALSVEIDLVEGWNLISLPLIPDVSDTEVILAEVLENVDVVWSYEEGTWTYYLPAAPEFSTLTDMEDGKGYWIKMTADDTLPIYGSELPDPPILPPVYSVDVGWNLIGFKSIEDMPVEEYLTTLPLDTQSQIVIYRWDALPQNYELVCVGMPKLGVIDLESGSGYWLYLTEAGYIAPP